MKKKVLILSIMAIFAFSINMGFQLSKNEQGMANLFLSNLDALATPDETSSIRCYGVTNNCWFIGCSTVTQCNGCSSVSADGWSEAGMCKK